MSEVDAPTLARLLSARFSIQMQSGYIDSDGGRWPTIRPTTPAEPNGFGVLVGRGPRIMQAVFRPDTFARALLRSMAEADDEARASFVAFANSAAASGVNVSITLDGSPAAPEAVRGPWERIDIECNKKMPVGRTVGATGDDPALTVTTICLTLALSLMTLEGTAEDSLSVPGLPEGAKMVVVTNRYERSAANRAMCLMHFGPSCAACGFDFGVVYGELGEGFAEVHHRVPLSQMGGRYVLDPIKDLVPLCSNCHSMVHRADPVLEVDELRARLLKVRERQAPH